jgi:4-hydroxy-2-oxoheptanedioate aldolase
MLTPDNKLKSALTNRRRQIGLWLALADAYSAELCATTGFDFLVIDGEHAPNDLRTMLAALQAIAAYPVEPIVRLPHGDSALIKQVLDIGATTLLIPMVETAAEAQALVRATRYPPEGVRGVGSSIARSARWSSYEDYHKVANEQVCLIVQIETFTAVENAEEIAAVDGVDGVLIGPADLAASMGLLGDTSNPRVQAAVEDAIGKIVATGTSAGLLCIDESLAKHYMAAGASFVAVGIDTTLLVNSAAALAKSFDEDDDTGHKVNVQED